jgi:hypothetical protein
MRRKPALPIFLAGLVFACIAVGGCSKLPAGWPLKELKPPPGSIVRVVPRKIDNVRERLNMLPEIGPGVAVHPDWEVAFDHEKGWSEVASSFDSQMAALGYTRWQPQNKSEDDAQTNTLLGIASLDEAVHIFTAPDKAYTVLLLNGQGAVSEENAIEHEGGFIIQISKGVSDGKKT